MNKLLVHFLMLRFVLQSSIRNSCSKKASKYIVLKLVEKCIKNKNFPIVQEMNGCGENKF